MEVSATLCGSGRTVPVSLNEFSFVARLNPAADPEYTVVASASGLAWAGVGWRGVAWGGVAWTGAGWRAVA